MKLNTLLLSSLFISSLTAAEPTTTESLTVKQEGIKYIKMLGSALKTELKAHMQKDPTGLETLAFCTGSADTITKEVNTKLPSYAKVRRTALKVRNNTVNKPDMTDTHIMQAYEVSIKDHTFTPKDIEVVKEGNVTRIYKPLVTKGVCLKCHGSNLTPQIVNALNSAYPEDKATGFKEGELRGVIVAEIANH